MGTLFSLSKSATSIALDISEIALLLFGILLVVGLIGEYAKSERWKRYARTFVAAHAEQGTAALTAANAGRRLTSEQKNKLATILTRFAPTAITLEWTSAGGQESVDLAKDINDAIVGAGIPMTTANRAILMDQYFKGVLLRVGDDRKSEASAIAGFLIEANLATSQCTPYRPLTRKC